MTLLQRYGIFIGIPSLILLLIIGLMLIRPDSETDESVKEALANQAAAVIIVETQEPQKLGKTDDLEPAIEPDEVANIPTDTSTGRRIPITEQQEQARELGTTDTQELAKTAKPGGEPVVSKEVIAQAFQDLKPNVKVCYEELLKDFPEASGKLSMNFVFETENGMSRLQMAEFNDDTTLFDRKLHDCVAESVGALEFQQMPDGGRLAVTYPFDFRPADSQK